MTKRVMVLDIETYSGTDLISSGVYKYAEDKDFCILLIGYSFDDGEVKVADIASGDPFPDEVRRALTGVDDVLCVAHNANFERTCLARYLGVPLPPERWRDTMIMAAYCGLPMSLDSACKALGFTEDYAKDARGKALIKLFSCPHKPTKAQPRTRIMPPDEPEKWQTYIAYNRQDVVAERRLYKTLEPFMPPEREWEYWCLDQRINDRGVKFDRRLAECAVSIGEAYKAELTRKAVELTGLDNPKSVSQVKNWLYEQEGVEVASLNKKVIADVVASLTGDGAREFMAIRAELSKSADKKYAAMLRSGCGDDHIRGCFQFYGGHTGRFAGRLVQLQNLRQNHLRDLDEARALVKTGDLAGFEMLYDNVSATLGELTRTALIPETGHRFVVSDFSAIECRVVAWLAGEQWVLDAFRGGKDIYCETASMMFGVPVVKHGLNGELRQKGKIATLACGYGGGVGALKAFGADRMGMSEAAMVETVDKWRAASPHIVRLWRTLERSAARCIAYREPVRDETSGTVFRLEGGILWMILPSGRRMAYYDPRYADSTKHPGKKSVSFMAQNQMTRKWERVETFGGRLVENCVQAIARDILLEKMRDIELAGHRLVAHVHDEVILSVPADKADDILAEVGDIMARELPWAEGLPLRGDGYTGDYYFKD